MPKGKAGSGRQDVPRPFLLRHGWPAPTRSALGSRAWAVKQGERWRFASEVCVQVHLLTLNDFVHGDCLSGVGVVRSLQRGHIVITS